MSKVLNNFYKDNASSLNDFIMVLDAGKMVHEEIKKYTDQIRRNFVIGEMETYRIIDIQKIPISNATYNLEDVLSISHVVEFLGMADTSMVQKIIQWNTPGFYTDDVKINAIDISKKYIEFSAQTVYPFSGQPSSPSFEVVLFDMYDGDTKFQIGVDYDIKNNKLYLLSERCCSESINKNKIYTLRNIAIDYDTPRRFIGENFKLPRYQDFSKDVFNEMLGKLTKAALEGPSIIGMENGINIVTGVANSAAVYDKYNSSGNRKSMWDNHELTPFDFIIEIPALYSSSESLSDIIKRYVDAVKLTASNYEIRFNSVYDDFYSRHMSADDDYHRVKSDMMTSEEYNYRVIFPQTNNVAFRSNINFTTEFTHGFSKFEESFVEATDTSTNDKTIVIF